MPIDLSTITIPTPEPYQKNEPDQQRENLAFVVLQVIETIKQQNPIFDVDIVQAIKDLQLQTAPMSEIVQAIKDLQFQTAHITVGEILDIQVSRKTLSVIE